VDRVLAEAGRVDAWHAASRARGGDRHLDREPEGVERLYEAVAAFGPPEPTRQRAVLDAVIRRDLATMVAAARARGAAVVLSGYPNAKPANGPIRAAAADLGVPFVDQQADFDALLAAEGDPGRWFLLDGHCTSAGYGRMARNVAQAIEPLRTAPPSPPAPPAGGPPPG